jgi:HSP20 family molecular chaperone IbpA
MPATLALAEPLLPFAAINDDGAWSPPVDVREHPSEYTVVADLPGVEPSTVEVTTTGDLLTIAGVRRDRLRAGGVPVRLERPTGKLRRSLQLHVTDDLEAPGTLLGLYWMLSGLGAVLGSLAVGTLRQLRSGP